MKKILRTSMLLMTLMAAIAAATTPVDVITKVDGGEPIPVCPPSRRCGPIIW
jgi:hypothetical protein